MKTKKETLSKKLVFRETWKNERTGKVVEVDFIPRPVDKTRKAKAKYVMVFDRVTEAFQSREINYDEYAILNFCISLIDWEFQYAVHPTSGAKASIKDIAYLTGKDEDFVGRTIKSLDKKGFINLEREGKGYSINIPYNVGYKGRLEFNPALKQSRHNPNIDDTDTQ